MWRYKLGAKSESMCEVLRPTACERDRGRTHRGAVLFSAQDHALYPIHAGSQHQVAITRPSYELIGAWLEVPISVTVARRPSCRAWQDFRDAEPYFWNMPMNSDAGSQYDPRHAVCSCRASPEWRGRVKVHGLVE